MPRAPPSFPTRRSSDLRRGDRALPGRAGGQGAGAPGRRGLALHGAAERDRRGDADAGAGPVRPGPGQRPVHRLRRPAPETAQRSEEHTSELQSRFDLVCRAPHPLSLHDALPIFGAVIARYPDEPVGKGLERLDAEVSLSTVPLNVIAGGTRMPELARYVQGLDNARFTDFVAQLLKQLKDRKSTRLNSSHVSISYAARPTLFPYTTLFRSSAR